MRSRRPKALKTKSCPWLSRVAVVAFSVAMAIAPRAFADPWPEHVQHLSGQERLIETLENEINELIEQKRHTEDQAALKRIIDEMAAKHKQLVQVSEEHNTEVLHVRFKHPEKADTLALKYRNYEPKSLTQMESDFGLDGRLDRIKQRVVATFPAAPVEKEKPAPLKISPLLRLPASEAVPSDEDAPDKIILKK